MSNPKMSNAKMSNQVLIRAVDLLGMFKSNNTVPNS